ncbi:MAG: MFS transporter, partial [Clostridia bacterium]|nr:MFS transporter [Clostridia bacterium]
MKLNYKRVILVGMAFFLISAFWQAYDAIIPLILTNHFGLPQTASGAVMSIDNILAVFMLPLFGALSDKVNTKMGKRTPFILIGTLIATVSFVALTLIDNYQLAQVVAAG